MRNHEQPGRSRTLTACAALLFSILIFSSACAPWQFGAEKNVVKNGISFETFRDYEKGSKLGILTEDTVIDGWPCRKGFIVFYPDWRLDELLLFRDYERNGVSMPAGTWVFPNEDGNPGICMFPRDMETQGYICRGSWMGKEGMMTSFHANGKLKHFYPRKQVEADGVPCKGSIFSGISLHENGRLHECVLEKAMTIEGVNYPKGTALRFDREGRLIGHQ